MMKKCNNWLNLLNKINNEYFSCQKETKVVALTAITNYLCYAYVPVEFANFGDKRYCFYGYCVGVLGVLEQIFQVLEIYFCYLFRLRFIVRNADFDIRFCHYIS